MTPQEVNKALAGRFMQALDCLEAVERAGLSLSALAADPEAIKKFIEAVDVFVSGYHPDFKGFDRVGSVTGRDIDLLRAALRAIGKEQE